MGTPVALPGISPTPTYRRYASKRALQRGRSLALGHEDSTASPMIVTTTSPIAARESFTASASTYHDRAECVSIGPIE
jgi:hypothetical protein